MVVEFRRSSKNSRGHLQLFGGTSFQQGRIRVIPMVVLLVDQSPETHASEYQSSSSDASLATSHTEHAFALEDFTLLCFELGVSREVAVGAQPHECSSSWIEI